MLNNFIYAQTKDLFLEALNAGNILDEAIVFIEDTKEIWNHGHYFAGTPDSFGGILVGNDEATAEDGYIFIDEDDDNSVDVYTTEQIDEKISNLQPTLINGENIKTINGESILGSGNLNIANRIVNITGAELKELRDTKNLTAGTYYRITDYVTTTLQENTRSAGHAFDVIVMATDTATLSEEAMAAVHEGDTYFSNSNLSAWKIWYNLDNDAERFAWADTENGKGVIYRMIDEYNNDLPYDFKNIMYVDLRKTKINAEANYYGTWWKGELVRNVSADKQTGSNSFRYAWVLTNVNGPSSSGVWYTDSESITSVDTIFYTYDGNDFLASETIRITNIAIGQMQYTFGNALAPDSVLSEFVDYTISIGGGCCNNIIKPMFYIGTNKQELNVILFGNSCQYNTFGDYCRYNTLGYSCQYNTFGNDFHDNTFGNYFESNSFGDYCNHNTFRDGCSHNTFGDFCNYNTLGTGCNSNSFGDGFESNSFGENYRNNIFGENCKNNTFGKNCSHNTFRDGCSNNTFGNDCNSNNFETSCQYNFFEQSCNYNTFGNGCQYNSFGDYCNYNTFGQSCSYNTFGDGCSYNTFGNGCQYNTFGDGCSYNNFGNGSSNNVLKVYYRYITFGEGVQGVTLQNETEGDSENQVQNYRVANGTHRSSSQLVVDVVRGKACETTIALDSDGNIKVYCAADFDKQIANAITTTLNTEV